MATISSSGHQISTLLNLQNPSKIGCGIRTSERIIEKEREFFLRAIVFGAKDTGKHVLINANFPKLRDNNQAYTRNNVDFMSRTLTIPYNLKKYHFWTFRLNDDSANKEVVWRSYYKSAGAFIFVFDITNAESFRRLEQCVESVLKVVPKEEFFGVLVANKTDREDKREVSNEEAEAFKEKYGFAKFIETNQSQEERTPQILSELDCKLKMTFEAI